MSATLLKIEGMKGYYQCKCSKKYTAKVRRCGNCGLLFESFHQVHIPIEKQQEKN